MFLFSRRTGRLLYVDSFHIPSFKWPALQLPALWPIIAALQFRAAFCLPATRQAICFCNGVFVAVRIMTRPVCLQRMTSLVAPCPVIRLVFATSGEGVNMFPLNCAFGPCILKREGRSASKARDNSALLNSNFKRLLCCAGFAVQALFLSSKCMSSGWVIRATQEQRGFHHQSARCLRHSSALVGRSYHSRVRRYSDHQAW